MSIKSNVGETAFSTADKNTLVRVRDYTTNKFGYAAMGDMLGGGSMNATDGLTALAGGAKSGATALTAGINRVSTVATIADSVLLPASVAGMVVHVVNGAANAMQVFGAGTDTINDVATATGVSQAGNKSATYVCPVAGKWYRILSA